MSQVIAVSALEKVYAQEPVPAVDLLDLRESVTLKVAVLIPCRNEERTIGMVVRDFRQALPDARMYVYANDCTDDTEGEALRAGAVVAQEPVRGKGNVVRRMFADIEADAYVLVDGDGTYDASSAPEMIRLLFERSLDVVNGARTPVDSSSYRTGHALGNRLFTKLVATMFGRRFEDMLSGYRVLSRRFVKSFPTLAHGFEIETELTIHALELDVPVLEFKTPYRSRPEGSVSKLSTLRDGFRILRMILILVRHEKPLLFFGLLAALLASVSIVLFWPVFLAYLETGLVQRFPTAILSTGLMILSWLSLTCGLVLDTLTRARKEMKRLAYLGLPGPLRIKAR